MNQSIRDNPNKMMPVPYNLSETHQGFPTSSPCPRFSAAKNCDFRTRFGAPVSSACAMTPGAARRHKPGTLLCLGSASMFGLRLYIDTLVYSHHPAPLALLEVVQLVGKTIRVWWNYVPDTSRYQGAIAQLRCLVFGLQLPPSNLVVKPPRISPPPGLVDPAAPVPEASLPTSIQQNQWAWRKLQSPCLIISFRNFLHVLVVARFVRFVERYTAAICKACDVCLKFRLVREKAWFPR